MAVKLHSSREVIIRTPDWEQAAHFYGSVLGLPMTYSTDTMVGFETGAFCLYVEKGAPHTAVFEFLVSDVAAAKRELTAAGCSVVEEDPKRPRCYLRDPFGLIFNLGRG
jgi:catechol 2,3-dioxygenase-like lactoylglutathione lyase family enzyme